MMKSPKIRRPPQPSEEGFILVVVIFMLALIMLSLMVAAPQIKKDIQRDRDLETMHRGMQYRRAIKLYYKKFGAYPPSIDALIKPTNNIRFLRKRYTDPITGKDDWKPIHLGQNKAPTAMGFFGQPIMGSTMGGMGGGLGLNCPTSTGSSSMFGSSGSGSTFGSSGSSGSSFGSSGSSFGSSGSSFGSSGSGFGSSGCSSPVASADDTSTDSSNSSGSSGTTGSNAGGDSSGSGTGTGSGTGLTGQTFGGGGIIGFSPNSSKESILVYKKKNHYNEWEFVYDPIADQMMSTAGMGTTASPTGNSGSPGMNPTPGPGGTGGTGFGNSFGGGGSSTPPPSSPQQ
jgi:hypothetical protein